jgi:hypothetical protein
MINPITYSISFLEYIPIKYKRTQIDTVCNNLIDNNNNGILSYIIHAKSGFASIPPFLIPRYVVTVSITCNDINVI